MIGAIINIQRITNMLLRCWNFSLQLKHSYFHPIWLLAFLPTAARSLFKRIIEWNFVPNASLSVYSLVIIGMCSQMASRHAPLSRKCISNPQEIFFWLAASLRRRNVTQIFHIGICFIFSLPHFLITECVWDLAAFFSQSCVLLPHRQWWWYSNALQLLFS